MLAIGGGVSQRTSGGLAIMGMDSDLSRVRRPICTILLVLPMFRVALRMG
ncbi:hypothetical protein JOF47_001587 [Paeniglutamicibacter kerguelensis]|uniref:Uncharacterized protein n=1 Tax=Paeniglutamicibacter kerguelensis TaxID=254788 RepID=A0ABS4XC92_9MICC|nr:hypothetical protein [Paeniglutamicibacter kerguelensis]